MGLYLANQVQPICSPQYIRNEKASEYQLNSIPLMWSGGKIQMYFPRPFQILGLNKEPLGDLPDPHVALPYYAGINAQFETPANQNTYKDITPLLMIELAIANTYPIQPDPNAPGPYLMPAQYLAPGIQNIDYRGYFTKYLNEKISAEEPRQWLNSFIQPSSRFWQFATDNAADTAPVWNGKFYSFIEFIEQASDQRLFGAPGIYIIDPMQTDYETEWLLGIDYETFQEV